MRTDYNEFLNKKDFTIQSINFDIDVSEINPILFSFQKDIVKWAVKKGHCAVFLDTGLGKTFIQLEWARIIGKTALIFAPLSVARQTIREGKKIGIDVNYVRSEADIVEGINITNYEMVEHFSGDNIGAIILDESSILKSLSGKIKQKLISQFKNIPYKLCCTATPAPNDYTELGNHAEFLNICSMKEMLAMFFINANKEHTYIFENTTIIKSQQEKLNDIVFDNYGTKNCYYIYLLGRISMKIVFNLMIFLLLGSSGITAYSNNLQVVACR